MNTNELWQAVLGELELSLSKANFTTWFKNTFVLSVNPQEVCIGVPNMFTKAWLEKKYNKEILQSIQNITDSRIRAISYKVEIHPQTPQLVVISGQQKAQVQEPEQQAPAFADPYTAAQPQEYSQGAVAQDVALNKKYIFENFIVGKQNELSHAAAQAVAGQPGEAYNPLFIYGGVGLGKTHLLQAIGHEMLRRNARTKVLYVTCERFTNDFIHSVRNGKVRDFKQRYRTIDLLLVDDIQFITGKEGTQEEFFHTFNQLYQNNKQIVISSDRPPKAIPALENRLVSRFECGMMTDVGSPDFETRVAILELKCKERSYLLATELLHCIANIIQSNVRELEGGLNKIIAFHQFKNIKPTAETIKPILSSFVPSNTKKTISIKHLIQTVAAYYDVNHLDLVGKSREKRYAFTRQVIMFLMREELKASYPTIGTELGGRDHTTVLHACRKAESLVDTDDDTKHMVQELIQQIENSLKN